MVLSYDIGNTHITIIGGINEIGGNCIIIEDNDQVIIFDQGIRFSLMRRFYGGSIRPTGVGELRELGVLPNLSNYSSFTVFISHLHLDHVGLLSNLPTNATAYLPDFYDMFINWFRNRTDWLQFMEPRIGVIINKVMPLAKYGEVTAIPVMHSAYPAYAYLYDNGNTKILYTGDFRLDSLLRYVDKDLYVKLYDKVFPYLFEEPIDVDLLIIEGTNFQPGLTPITGEHTIHIIEELLNTYSANPFIIALDSMDVDTFLSLTRLFINYGKMIIIASKELLDTAKYLLDHELLNEDVTKFLIAADEDPILSEVLNEVARRSGDYVIFTEINDVPNLLRKMKSLESIKILISMEAEAPSEGSFEGPLDEWLSMHNTVTYRVRLSGHYYPHQLRTIAQYIRPRRVVPIHTEEPQLMLKLINKYANPNPY